MMSRIALHCALAGALGLAAAAAEAAPTGATDASADYRQLGAEHLYEVHEARIYHGRLPPLLYAIAVTETEIDENGHVLSATVIREPAAAKEVGPWVVKLIQAASPFPRPMQAGRTIYRDVWLVDKSYTFQLHTLSEGQD